MPKKLNMQVRRATAADIPALADVGFSAFFNSPIDAHWFPLRNKYPHDYHRWFIDDFTMRLVTPGNVIMVVEVDDTEDKSHSPDPERAQTKKKLTAYVIMVKHSPDPQDLADWNPDTPLNQLTRASLTLHTSSIPNRAMSADAITAYYAQAAKTYTQHLDSPASEQKWLDGQVIAVDPAYQRRGVGEKLIEWVFNTLKKEGIPIFGDAVEFLLPFYTSLGARPIGKISLPARVVDSGDGGEPVRLEAVEVVLIMGRPEWAIASMKSRI